MADIALRAPRHHRAGLNLPLVLDVGERAMLIALFTRLVFNNWAVIRTPGHWFNVLLLLSEGLAVVLLLVRRRSSEVSPRLSDWLFAVFATAGPLLVQADGGAPLVPQWLGGVLLVGGLFTQISAKVALGRSFGIVAANRGVRVSGPYRLVRHPMYLGYICVQLGFLLLAPNVWNLIVYTLAFTAQVFRLLAEERLLARDPAYRAFQTQTRYRLLPGLF